MKAMLM
jgi:septal ring factor EnvC (AmiA/AmiB activator)